MLYNPNAQRWMNCDGEAKEKSTTKTFTLKSQSLIYTRNIFYLSIVFQSGVAFRHYYNGSIFVDCSQFVFFMTQKAHMFFIYWIGSKKFPHSRLNHHQFLANDYIIACFHTFIHSFRVKIDTSLVMMMIWLPACCLCLPRL